MAGQPDDGPSSIPTSASESRSASPSPARSTPPASPTPVTEIREITETQTIPFETTTVEDPNLDLGTSVVRTSGVPGVKAITYRITVIDGEETDRTVIAEEVVTAPVTEVVAVGTRSAEECDPNYEGACVPIAEDVDCAGGGGNGPDYVTGPVRVVGTDIYDLDRDGDGWGCEPP